MTYKTIFSGRLEFGNARSFDKVLTMYQHRVENYYKMDVLLKEEEVFIEEAHALDVPRFITQSNEKSWKNTLSVLEFVAQYAIAGSLNAWMVDEGKVKQQHVIEPTSDKAAVQSFLSGREMVQERGRESEAMQALSRAIEKYARHALAYERRGYVNYLLHNFSDALYDFSKSIDINPKNADPYIGRAQVYMSQKDYTAAIPDLDKAIKNSIPLQDVYWRARRLKADCHLALEEYDSAVFELKLFTKRQFGPESTNYKWRKKALADYGKALLQTNALKDAIDAFNRALGLTGNQKDLNNEAEPFLLRGIALQRMGQSGFRQDWQEAASLGSKRAARLLQTA